ncbi:hypothetical protein [Heliomicrobium gestii]|uniref:hypothetical protein n=1 Tax=Heliomicrobium gestii TaxID=2699 RepID=UPI00195CDA9A|nr:hypothetical protein [Heliomicrobium gestii]MBM7867389.1 hypothetical protein [Heliomicrobium gestii]
MIHFDPVPEPRDFDEKCRKRGRTWLEAHPDVSRPKDFWNPFRSQLADGFRNLCAYTAMYEPVGTVDHYLSYTNRPELTYEWSNYRFAASWVNCSKQNADDNILDPFKWGMIGLKSYSRHFNWLSQILSRRKTKKLLYIR